MTEIQKEKQRIYKINNREKIKEQQIIYRNNEDVKSSRNKASQDWKNRNIEKVKISRREHYINKRYNLTELEYNEMVIAQDNKCLICKIDGSLNKNKKLFIDHEHKTGKVRGLLCNRCNSILGYVNDDIDILNSSVKYLQNYQ